MVGARKTKGKAAVHGKRGKGLAVAAALKGLRVLSSARAPQGAPRAADPYHEALHDLTAYLRRRKTPALLRRTLAFFARFQPAFFRHRDEVRVERAFEYARKKHARQKRESGEPYITHPLETAKILAGYGMDADTVVAGLLHDVLEDTDADALEFKKCFGPTVFHLVDGVSKLDALSRDRRSARAAYLRKMFLASKGDIRILIIKLADKLHNLRTLHHLPEARRRRIAQDVLEVYAPLALKLGITEMERELGELALRHLEPARYRELQKKLAPLKRAKRGELQRVAEVLRKHPALGGGRTTFEVRERSVYEVHRKMEQTGKALDELYDYVRLVVLCEHASDCYHALHVIHAAFHPVPKKLKDFIASPRSPTYRGLHTTVVGPAGHPVKVYIRTRRMDETAREGVLAWMREARFDDAAARKLAEFFSMEVDPSLGQDAFLESLQADVLPFTIYLFSPEGGRVGVPAGSTVLDYAFQAYGKRALRLRQGYVNDRPVPPWTLLNEGDRVTLSFYRRNVATPDWLDYVTTYKARRILGDLLPRAIKQHRTGHAASVKVRVRDRVGMLRDLCAVFADLGVNIERLNVFQLKPGHLYLDKFTFFVSSKKKLQALVERLGRVRGVVDVESDFA